MKTPSWLFLFLIIASFPISSCHRIAKTAEETDVIILENETIVTREQFESAGLAMGNLGKVMFEQVIRVNGIEVR